MSEPLPPFTSEPSGLDVAIIGWAGRFPGAASIADFWRNVKEGRESISFFSKDELAAAGVGSTLLDNSRYVRARGALDGVELFDAGFFGYSPAEADRMDPQHRILLECAWQALEDAGYDPSQYSGPIGTFAGSSLNSYLLTNLSQAGLLESPDAMGVVVGNNADFLATRISYKLGLTGPSVTLNTACSTSLVAVHLACQSLLGGECDLALAGGVSVSSKQKQGYLYHEEGIHSPDGHCRAFDEQAQGTVGGSGAALVVLKPLDAAVADRDWIYAVVRGSAINNDGDDKIGFTASSLSGQTRVISQAHAVADVDPETIEYVEAHGTGTALGDPIEIAALTQAFRARTSKRQFCAIGSVKTNVGHLDAAAGVTGLIKASLALYHEELPPSLHYRRGNPEIDFAASPFFVNAQLRPWRREGKTPRRAAVSSFGIGGTNAHAILEEAPPAESFASDGPQLLLLSGRSENALREVTENLVEHLRRQSGIDLADVAYTLRAGRRRFNHRRMLVADGLEDALGALATLDVARVRDEVEELQDRPVVFMFPGQGAQYPKMAADLYASETEFRRHVDHCAQALEPELGLDLRELVFAANDQSPSTAQRLNETWLTQPALFSLEYALARLWMSWGVSPQAMIGHSIGEYVAATLAGVFSLGDALRVVAARGRLMQQMAPGAMLAVAMSAEKLAPLLEGGLALAAVNAPQSCVAAGPTDELQKLESHLAGEGITHRRLHTSHAFHSPLVEPLQAAFRELMFTVKRNRPSIPFVSNVTGTWMTAEDALDADYWVRQLREPVQLAAGFQELLREPQRVLLEVGPGRTLATLAAQQPPADGRPVQALCTTRHPRDTQSDDTFLLNTLGRLWLAGVKIDWAAVDNSASRRRIPLPTYPFERRRHWIEKPSQDGPGVQKKEPANWFYEPAWSRAALPAHNSGESSRLPKKALIFLDDAGLGGRLADRLRQCRVDVITARNGESFRSIDKDDYEIRYNHADDYRELWRALPEDDQPLVVHLGNFTAQPGRSLYPSQEHLQEGYYSLLNLAKACPRRKSQDWRLLVVANGLHDVTGEEQIEPAKALSAGPAVVIGQELAGAVCQHIDALTPTSEDDWQMLLNHLVAEANSDGSDRTVAYRGRWRWVRKFLPVEVPAAGATTSLLRDEGVYLITGGLGGVGLLLAEHLANSLSRPRLALVGRSGIPGEDRPAAKKAVEDALSRIRKSGAEPTVIAADVADKASMRGAIEKTVDKFGAIHGVIHAAAIAGGGLIDADAAANSAEELAPKVTGTCILHELLGDMRLDFLMLCSSQSAVLGGVGRVAYTSGNAFQDAFARSICLQGGGRVFSVNWDRWENVGMAAQANGAAHSDAMPLGMSPGEGIEAFARIMSGYRGPQVIVSMRDFAGVVDYWKKRANAAPQSDSIKPAVQHSRPSLETTYVAPTCETQRRIAAIWQEVLGLQEVGIHDRFDDLGGDSLIGLRVLARIRESMQADLRIRDLYEHSTVARLAAHLDNIQWTTDGAGGAWSEGRADEEVEQGRL